MKKMRDWTPCKIQSELRENKLLHEMKKNSLEMKKIQNWSKFS